MLQDFLYHIEAIVSLKPFDLHDYTFNIGFCTFLFNKEKWIILLIKVFLLFPVIPLHWMKNYGINPNILIVVLIPWQWKITNFVIPNSCLQYFLTKSSGFMHFFTHNKLSQTFFQYHSIWSKIMVFEANTFQIKLVCFDIPYACTLWIFIDRLRQRWYHDVT